MADSTFLEWPFFDDFHRALGRDLRVWATDNVPAPEHVNDDDEADAYCTDLVRKLGQDGWLKNAVPPPYGAGPAFSVRSLALCRETLGYFSSLADFAFGMQGLGSGAISLFGDDDMKARYLRGVAKGTQIPAFAISESSAGSDPAAMKTAAVKDGGDYVLDGEKTWISNAGIADYYVVFARTGEGPGAKGISAFVIEAGTPGFSVSARIRLSAPHPLGTLRFEGCRVKAGQMIGAPGQGFKIAMGTLDVFRTTVGAAALGFARRALDEAIKWSNQRTLFGQHLADFQITQTKLGEMALAIDASALLVYRSAWAKDRAPEGRITREAAMAKLFATEEAQKVIDQAVQLYGGLGVVSGNPAEALYREIRPLRIYEGTSEVQKLVIAGEVQKAAKRDS